MVTITCQEDLDHFFDYFSSQDKTPKLHLDAPSTVKKREIDSTLERSHSMFNLKKPITMILPMRLPSRTREQRRNTTASFPSPTALSRPQDKRSTHPSSPSPSLSSISTLSIDSDETHIASQQPSPPPSPIGPTRKKKAIKSFQLGGMLGAGAFGKVFLGMNEDDGNLMAVKQISIQGLNQQSPEMRNLEEEIELMSTLDHEHIVNYLGVKRDRGVSTFQLSTFP